MLLFIAAVGHDKTSHLLLSFINVKQSNVSFKRLTQRKVTHINVIHSVGWLTGCCRCYCCHLVYNNDNGCHIYNSYSLWCCCAHNDVNINALAFGANMMASLRKLCNSNDLNGCHFHFLFSNFFSLHLSLETQSCCFWPSNLFLKLNYRVLCRRLKSLNGTNFA